MVTILTAEVGKEVAVVAGKYSLVKPALAIYECRSSSSRRVTRDDSWRVYIYLNGLRNSQSSPRLTIRTTVASL